MKNNLSELSHLEQVYYHAGDIIASDRLKREDDYRQHGSVTCYEHSVAVTLLSVRLARGLRLNVDMESMIKGALLHDYFLYDWRSEENSITRREHGFNHAERALENAGRDFSLTAVSRDVIRRHMFPLNIRPPKYKESYIVSVADKVIATKEVCRFMKNKMKNGVNRSAAYMRRRKVPNV